MRLCLLRDDETDILAPIRSGASDQELMEQIRSAVFRKPKGHGLSENHFPHDSMSSIGG